MSARDWPTSIEPNMFTVAKLDPAILPQKIEVTTWSNLFGQGGSVSIDATMPEGSSPRRVDLARISVETGGPVQAQRRHLQALLDDWRTDDLSADWAGLIADARAGVRDYYAAEVAKYGFALTDAAPTKAVS